MNKLPTIIVSKFCRHTFFKNNTEETITEEYVLHSVNRNFKKQKNGYRNGVILVPINPLKFKCPIVLLKDGHKLMGEYKSRVEGEEPRKKVGVPNVDGTPAKFCDVVLYSREVLWEKKENSPLPSEKIVYGGINPIEDYPEWEIITILPKLDEEQPMPVDTLLYNHFNGNGGTQTNMTNEEFIKELQKSFLYWKDKGIIL